MLLSEKGGRSAYFYMTDKLLKKQFFSHTGTIFSNIAIGAAVFTLAIVLSGIISAILIFFWYLFLILATLFTLFIILIYYPNLFSSVSFDGLNSFINVAITTVAPVSAGISLLFSAVSVIFLAMGEPKRSQGRIIFSSVLIGVSAILFITLLVGVASK